MLARRAAYQGLWMHHWRPPFGSSALGLRPFGSWPVAFGQWPFSPGPWRLALGYFPGPWRGSSAGICLEQIRHDCSMACRLGLCFFLLARRHPPWLRLPNVFGERVTPNRGHRVRQTDKRPSGMLLWWMICLHAVIRYTIRV